MSTGHEEKRVGLCIACRHARPQQSRRGQTFWRCGRSEREPDFARYPRLPVLTCTGFERAPDAGTDR